MANCPAKDPGLAPFSRAMVNGQQWRRVSAGDCESFLTRAATLGDDGDEFAEASSSSAGRVFTSEGFQDPMFLGTPVAAAKAVKRRAGSILYPLVDSSLLRPAGPIKTTDILCSQFQENHLHPEQKIYDVSMYGNDMMAESLKHYYECCKSYNGHGNLIVTTSCFDVWRQAKKRNSAAKVIPAVPSSCRVSDRSAPRVFFFDDNVNLNLGGGCDAEGICNLRDVNTGEFVDFSIGKNGFNSETFFRHTRVHHSSEYLNVLVQANILDAITIPNYFSFIISLYAKPDERVLVFFDVNGVLVWDDTTNSKDMSEVLLSTMARFVQVLPKNGGPVDIVWDSRPALSLDKAEDLKSLVHRLYHQEHELYQRFWNESNCKSFLEEISPVVDLAWQKTDIPIQVDDFVVQYKRNFGQIRRSAMRDGMPESWFRCYKELFDGGNNVVLNTFGCDSRRVVMHSVQDAKQVLQLTIDYKLWSQRDVTKWNAQFENE